MHVFDAIESWLNEHRGTLEAAGAKVATLRSSGEKLKHSIVINVQGISRTEVDLIVWESGEAEFTTVSADGSVRMRHFDDVMHGETILTILAEIKAAFLVT